MGIEEPKDRPDEAEIEDYSKQLTRLQVQSQASSSQQAVPHIPSMMMGYPNQMVQPYPNQMMLYPAQMMAFYQSPMGVYPVPGALGYSAPRPPENSEADPGGILRFFNPTRLPSGEAQGTNVAQGTRVVPGQSGAS